jgi:hypothetical protein
MTNLFPRFQNQNLRYDTVLPCFRVLEPRSDAPASMSMRYVSSSTYINLVVQPPSFRYHTFYTFPPLSKTVPRRTNVSFPSLSLENHTRQVHEVTKSLEISVHVRTSAVCRKHTPPCICPNNSMGSYLKARKEACDQVKTPGKGYMSAEECFAYHEITTVFLVYFLEFLTLLIF